MKTICTIKKLIAISLFFLMSLNSNSLFCQILSVPETSNFFEYLEHFTESKRYSDLDTTEGGSKAQVERLLSYWGSRLHPHGDFSIANNAIIDYALNYNHVNSTVNPNWTCVGPSNTPSNNQNRGVGQIHRISFDPFYGISNNTVYASTGYGGLWRSQDNGENWENVNTDLLPIASVSDVAICPTNNQVLFISTGNPDGGVELAYGPNWSNINPVFTIGIYRSIDYGNTWHTINNGLLDEFITNGGTIRKIEVDKLNPNILVAATSNGIYMTSNALATTPIWTNVFSGLTGSDKDFSTLSLTLVYFLA
ncbi:MAG: hypothetical protein RBS07_17975 [Lentimicrobium sp.]|jgi:hypothetical protein|nr:hypothetical protein [Lentimicrobium sp.]